MSIPFYYSFNEFKNNYNHDLEKWQNTYPDGDEKDFLDCLYNLYKPYFGFSKDGEFREFKDKEIKVYFRPNQIPIDSMGYYPNDCDEDDFGVYRYMTTADIIKEINYRWVNIEYDNSLYLTTLGIDSTDDIDNIKITDNLNLILLMAKFKIFDEVDNKGRIIKLAEGNGDKYTSDYLITARTIKELDLYYKFEELEILFLGIIQLDEVKYQNFKLSIPKIFYFIQEKLNPTTPPIKTEEVTPTPIETEEIEHLSEKQINVIGLMKLAGFDKFLREKNPDITDSQIAKFYVKINSCDKMNNHESIRPHLTTDLNSKHHPFYKTGKKEIYETILRQYGISPQANE